jgi:hypothetical protein
LGYPAGIYNLIVEQGASLIRSIIFTDENGATPDLSSGYTAEFVIASDYGVAAALTLTNGSGVTLAAGGSIEISATPAQTSGIAAGEYHRPN